MQEIYKDEGYKLMAAAFEVYNDRGYGLAEEIYQECLEIEGYKLMAAAFEVYNDRGYGLAEEIYQECLEIEFELRGVPFRAKQELKCFYKGRELKKRYIPDLFVFGSIVVELKAVSDLAPEHEAQLVNYLRISRQPVGYLINFGHKGTLEWKRFILSEFIPKRLTDLTPASSPGPTSI